MKKNISGTIVVLLILCTLSGGAQSLIRVQPKKIKASSTSPGSSAKELCDGSLRTYWGPHNKKGIDPRAGIGEHVDFYFDRPYQIKLIKIHTGFGHSREIYLRNNRPTYIRLTYSDGTPEHFRLKDIFGFQEVTLDKTTESIRLLVLDKKFGTDEKVHFYTFGVAEVEFYATDPVVSDFTAAIKSNDLKAIGKHLKQLQKKRNDILEVDVDGCTPVEYAIRSGNVELVRFFIKNGLNAKGIKIPLIDIMPYTELYEKTAWVVDMRRNYPLVVSDLKAHRLPWDELLKLEAELLSKMYSYTFTHERDTLTKLTALAFVNDLKQRPHTHETLAEVASFSKNRKALLQILDQDASQEVNNKLHEISIDILEALLLKEREKVLAIPLTLEGWEMLDSFSSQFTSTYDIGHPAMGQLQTIRDLVQEQRIAILSKFKDSLLDEIYHAETSVDLAHLKGKYWVEADQPVVREFQKAFEVREDRIHYENSPMFQLPLKERIALNFELESNARLVEKIYLGLFEDALHILKRKTGTELGKFQKAFALYISGWYKQYPDMVNDPVEVSGEVVSTETQFGRTRETGRDAYTFHVERRYLKAFDALKEELLVTRNYQVFSNMFSAYTGVNEIYGDVLSMSYYSIESKIAWRWKENFHRFILYSMFNDSAVEPISANQQIQLDLKHVRDDIYLEKTQILTPEEMIDYWYSIGVIESQSRYSMTASVKGIKGEILECTYKSPTTDETYNVYFWREKIPDLFYEKLSRFQEDEYPLNDGHPLINLIGPAVTNPPKDWKSAVELFNR